MHDVRSVRSVQDVQHPQHLLTAEQVGRMLGIDRSTVYRLAESGRLPGAKIGRQWRFRPDHVERLLQAADGGYAEPALPPPDALQPVIEVTAHLLGVMVLVTDMSGQPLTEVANPCPWFRDHCDDPAVLAGCASEWEQLADGHDLSPRWRTGPLGWDCARAFIRSGTTLVGMLLAGGVAADDDDPRDLHRLDAPGRARVLATLPEVASTLSRITSDISSPHHARSQA